MPLCKSVKDTFSSSYFFHLFRNYCNILLFCFSSTEILYHFLLYKHILFCHLEHIIIAASKILILQGFESSWGWHLSVVFPWKWVVFFLLFVTQLCIRLWILWMLCCGDSGFCDVPWCFCFSRQLSWLDSNCQPSHL